MQKNVKKIVIGATIVAVLGIGCELVKKNSYEVPSLSYQSEVDKINKDVKMGQTKVFNPHQHYLKVKVMNDNSLSDAIINEKVSIPDGYEFISINNYEENDQDGFDVWYTNIEKVEVTSKYNEETKRYEFNNFGKIVREEIEDPFSEKRIELLKNKMTY